MMARNSMSEKLANDIDTAVHKIAAEAYAAALSHIRNNREAMDKLVEVRKKGQLTDWLIDG